jgi:hypothetical protein
MYPLPATATVILKVDHCTVAIDCGSGQPSPLLFWIENTWLRITMGSALN